MNSKSKQESSFNSLQNLDFSSPQIFHIASESAMLDFGRSFADYLIAAKHLDAVIELIGDVGAGKTTFVRGLATGLGISRPVTSPSFTISKSYAFPDNRTLTHYDFYRLKDPGLMAADLADAIHHHHLVLVEWGNSIANFLPDDHIKITITLNNDNSRNIHIVYDKNQITYQKIKNKKINYINNNSNILSLYLDTSTPTTILKLNNKEYTYEFNNTLSKNLLSFIKEKLNENGYDWRDIEKIVFMSGPGSFTGLRIGAAVVNTLAHELNIPLCDHHGVKHRIILPDYGRKANITKPRK